MCFVFILLLFLIYLSISFFPLVVYSLFFILSFWFSFILRVAVRFVLKSVMLERTKGRGLGGEGLGSMYNHFHNYTKRKREECKKYVWWHYIPPQKGRGGEARGLAFDSFDRDLSGRFTITLTKKRQLFGCFISTAHDKLEIKIKCWQERIIWVSPSVLIFKPVSFFPCRTEFSHFISFPFLNHFIKFDSPYDIPSHYYYFMICFPFSQKIKKNIWFVNVTFIYI